jgi:hypothetical protein
MTSKESLIGEWHIQEMEMWDSDYFNMEVQAYIKIDSSLKGEFQFGLVTGQIEGRLSSKKYEFIWEGSDENYEAHGSGWLQKHDNNDIIEGEFRFYEGDNSKFIAKRNNYK